MTGKTSRSVVLMVACVFVALAGTVSAATVTEGEATAAASAFIMADPVGSAVLRGRTVSTVYEGATRFLCRGNDIRQALARVFAPVGATTNLGRAANRAGAI